MRSVVLALSVALVLWTSGAALAQGTSAIRVATWNLGWHMDRALAEAWISACGATFERDPADRLWKPKVGGSKTGWQLTWGRNAPIQWDYVQFPPCDVYQANFKIVPVTASAYAKRVEQIARVLARDVRADVIAFQEVSGAAAVREVLPEGGAAYDVCTFTGHKVQRLAIAWKRSLGERVSCNAEDALSLPERPAKERPRPGLALTLRIDGKLVRFLTVHLKSSCVSPLESPGTTARGRLDGENEHCKVLHQQVPALEAWMVRQSEAVDGLVLLGDFNRNLGHEEAAPPDAVVRRPGSPIDSYTPETRVANLWREVNDGDPTWSRLALLAATCEAPAVASLCKEAKSRVLTPEELRTVSAPAALGCRNPLGLDHIAVGHRVRAEGGATKVSLGRMGRTLAASVQHPEPLLALSDHCPLAADLRIL